MGRCYSGRLPSEATEIIDLLRLILWLSCSGVSHKNPKLSVGDEEADNPFIIVWSHTKYHERRFFLIFLQPAIWQNQNCICFVRVWCVVSDIREEHRLRASEKNIGHKREKVTVDANMLRNARQFYSLSSIITEVKPRSVRAGACNTYERSAHEFLVWKSEGKWPHDSCRT
jgi:hypothetical protein